MKRGKIINTGFFKFEMTFCEIRSHDNKIHKKGPKASVFETFGFELHLRR